MCCVYEWLVLLFDKTTHAVFPLSLPLSTFKNTQPWRNAACSGLFVFAAMTDWLDGYLARRMNLSSPLGAFLDPAADKVCRSK